MRKALEAYRSSSFPIIHVIRLHKQDGSNVDLCRREAIENGAKIAAPNSEGAELVRGLRPSAYTALDSAALLAGRFQAVGEQEWVMYKPRWGAFYQTGLELFLRERGIDTLVFAGCNFPNCPRTSMYQASERDFRVVMVADSMSQVYDRGVQEMRNIGVHVCSLDEVLAAIR
ncbi:isochorismatase family cysteine hydrolase [Brevibacillus agri]|uniref:cysteine hydrolase family protein n=1 Tax=Brevibacillus agri TaxID=51101 RepID=UPI0030F3DEA6